MANKRKKAGPAPNPTPSSVASFNVSLERRAVLWLVAAFVVLVPLTFDPGSLIAFATPKALVSNSLSALLAGAIAVAALRYGFGVFPRSPLHLAVFGLIVAYVAATVFAANWTIAVFGAHDRSLGLLALLNGTILYLATVVAVRTMRDLRIVLGGLLGASLTIVAYAFIQRAGLDPLPWASGFGTIRAFATLGNPGVLGHFLATVGVLAAGVAWLAWRRGLTEWRWLVGIAVLDLAGAISSGTRAVALGLGAAILVLSLIVIVRQSDRRIRAIGAGLLVLLVAAGVASSLLTSQRAMSAMLGAVDSSADTSAAGGSVGGRLAIYSVAAKEFAARPILGVGPDNYTVLFPTFRPDNSYEIFGSSSGLQTSAHSWIAKIATDAGSVGLLSFAGILLTAGLLARRSREPDVAAVGAIATATFLGTGIVGVNDIGADWLFWLILALGTLPSTTLRVANRGLVAPGARLFGGGWQARARYPILGIALLLSLLPLRALWGSQAAEDNRQARVRGQVAAAIVAGESAVRHDPSRAEYWQGLGLAHAANREFGQAERAFTLAANLAPFNAVYLTNLARAQLSSEHSGTRAAGLETARKAITVDPNNGETHYALALAFGIHGDPAGAILESELAKQLQPVPLDPYVHEVAARSYLALGMPALAEPWLRSGLPRLPDHLGIETRLLLARALNGLNRREEAIAELQVILGLDPGHAAAARLRTEIQLGQ